MKKLKIAINGFGRIGRCILRSHIERRAAGLDRQIEFHLINLGAGALETYAHLFQYDSTHGFVSNISVEEHFLCTQYDKILTINITNPEEIYWNKYDVDLVLECTGNATTYTQNAVHIINGAKKVIVSAPCKDAQTIIHGVNNDKIDLLKAKVLSAGSCTTNCLAPIAKALNDNCGITSGFMTTIHAYTSDQNLLDARHKDLRRARAANLSMIPTSTGAARTIGQILPELDGKLDGVAVRVPVPNVSMIDLTFTSKQDISDIEINDIMKKAAKNSLDGILTVIEKELVSIDFNRNASSAIFDLTQTKVVNKNLCRVVAWYDNEWGFSNRMLDICNLIANIS